jgi:hypothetical protein
MATAYHTMPDPREPRVLPDPTDAAIAKAKHGSAKEALEVICESFYDGFQVLLHRDRLLEVYGEQALNKAFNEMLTERGRRR